MQSFFDLSQANNLLYVAYTTSTIRLRLRGFGIVNSQMSIFVADEATDSCLVAANANAGAGAAGTRFFVIQRAIIDKQDAHFVTLPAAQLRSDGKRTKLCLAKTRIPTTTTTTATATATTATSTTTAASPYIAETGFFIQKFMNNANSGLLTQVFASLTGLRNDAGTATFESGKQVESRTTRISKNFLDVAATTVQNINNRLSTPDVCTSVTFMCENTVAANNVNGSTSAATAAGVCSIPRSRAIVVSIPQLVGENDDYCTGAAHAHITSSPIVDGSMMICPPALSKPDEHYNAAICVQTAIGQFKLLQTVTLRVASPSFSSAVPLNEDFAFLASPGNDLIVAPRGASVVVGLTSRAPSSHQPQIVRFGTGCSKSTLTTPVDYDSVFPIQVVSDGKITIAAEVTTQAANSVSLLASGDLPANVWQLLQHLSMPVCSSVDGGASFQLLDQLSFVVVDDKRAIEKRFRSISILSNTAGSITVNHYRRIVIEGGQASQIRPTFPDGSEVRLSPSCEHFVDEASFPTLNVLDGSISLLRSMTSTPQKNLKLCVRRRNSQFDEDGRPIAVPFDGTPLFESVQFIDSGVSLTIVDASIAVVNLQLQHLRRTVADSASRQPLPPYVVTLIKGDQLSRVPLVFKARTSQENAEGIDWLRRQVLSSRVRVRIGLPCDSSADVTLQSNDDQQQQQQTSTSIGNAADDLDEVPLVAYGTVSRIFDTSSNQFVDAFEAHFSPSAKQVTRSAMAGQSVALCISLDASSHFVSISTTVQVVDRDQLAPVLIPAGFEDDAASVTKVARSSAEAPFDTPVGAAIMDPCVGEFYADDTSNASADDQAAIRQLGLSCSPKGLSPTEFRISQIVSRSVFVGPSNLGYMYAMRLLIPASKIELLSSTSQQVRSVQTQIQLYDLRATSRNIQNNLLPSGQTADDEQTLSRPRSASRAQGQQETTSSTKFVPTRLSFVRTVPSIWCIGEDAVKQNAMNTQVIFTSTATAGYKIGITTCSKIVPDSLSQRNITATVALALVDAPNCSSASISNYQLLTTSGDGSLIVPNSVATFVAGASNTQAYYGYKVVPVCNVINGRVFVDSGVYIASTRELSVIEVNEMTKGLVPIGQRTEFRFDLDGPGIRSDKRVFIRFMPVVRSNPRKSCESVVWPNFWEAPSSTTKPLDGGKLFVAFGGNVYFSADDTAYPTTEQVFSSAGTTSISTSATSSDPARFQVTGRVLCFSTDGIFFKTHPGVAIAVVPPVVRSFINPVTHEQSTSLVLSNKNLLMSFDEEQAASTEEEPVPITDASLAFDATSMQELGWPTKFLSSQVNLGPVPPVDFFPFRTLQNRQLYGTNPSSVDGEDNGEDNFDGANEENNIQRHSESHNAFLSDHLFTRPMITGKLGIEATRWKQNASSASSSSSSSSGSVDPSTRIVTAPFISSLPTNKYIGRLVFTNATSCTVLTTHGEGNPDAGQLHHDDASDTCFAATSVPVSFADAKVLWDDQSLAALRKTFDFVGRARQHLYDIQPGKFRRAGIDPLPSAETIKVTDSLAWRVCSTVDGKSFFSDEDLLRIYVLKDKLRDVGVDALAPLLKDIPPADVASVAADNDVVVPRVIINPDNVGYPNGKVPTSASAVITPHLLFHGVTNAQVGANQLSQLMDQVSVAVAVDCPNGSGDSAECSHDAIRRQLVKRCAGLIGLPPSSVAVQVWHAPSVTPTMRILSVTLQFSPSDDYSLGRVTNVLYKALDKDMRGDPSPLLPAGSAFRALGIAAVDPSGRQLVTSAITKWAFIGAMLKPVITQSEFDEYNKTREGRVVLNNYQHLFALGQAERLSMLPTDIDTAVFGPRSAVTPLPTSFPTVRSPDAGSSRTSFSGAPTFPSGQTYFGLFTVISLIPLFFVAVGVVLWRTYFTRLAIEEAAFVRTRHITRYQMPSDQLQSIISPAAKIAQAEQDQRKRQEQDIIELALSGKITRHQANEMLRRHEAHYSSLTEEDRFVLEDGEWRGVIADEKD